MIVWSPCLYYYDYFFFCCLFLLSFDCMYPKYWKCKHLIERDNMSISTSEKNPAIREAWKRSTGNWKKRLQNWLINFSYRFWNELFIVFTRKWAICNSLIEKCTWFHSHALYTDRCPDVVSSSLQNSSLMRYNMHPYGSHLTHSRLQTRIRCQVRSVLYIHRDTVLLRSFPPQLYQD